MFRRHDGLGGGGSPELNRCLFLVSSPRLVPGAQLALLAEQACDESCVACWAIAGATPVF